MAGALWRGAGAGVRDHLPGHKFTDAIDGMAIGNFRQDIAQVGFRVQFVEPGRLHQGVNRRGPFPTRIRSGKQIIFPIMNIYSNDGRFSEEVEDQLKVEPASLDLCRQGNYPGHLLK